MIEICLEKGEYTINEFNRYRDDFKRRTSKLDKVLRDMGFNDDLVDKLMYKDKLNYILIWYCLVIVFIIFFFIIYSI